MVVVTAISVSQLLFNLGLAPTLMCCFSQQHVLVYGLSVQYVLYCGFSVQYMFVCDIFAQYVFVRWTVVKSSSK